MTKFTLGILVVGMVCCTFNSKIYGQESTKNNQTETSNKYYNWFNLDKKENKILGISTDRAYEKLLKGKKLTTVVVAVIDGGVDINHEDLQGKIWVNKGEIPGNNIDDDHNGYVDDVYGWNFIGGKDGKNINEETLELTRLYKKYSDQFKNVDTSKLTGNDLQQYHKYQKIKEKFLEKADEANKNLQSLQPFLLSYHFADSIIKSIVNKDVYTLDDIKKIDTQNDKRLIAIKKFMSSLYKKGFTKDDLNGYVDQLKKDVDYNYNINFDPRSIVGDDPNNWSTGYGNNDVKGEHPDHGTMVSSIIAANRHNNIGMKGIADSVKIMSIRTVPDGDERDKDVANAIRYAVDNGAQIINGSFGKPYSPQKRFVDEALLYAQSKGVLIVHAAGNDAEDTDTIPSYPSDYDANGNKLINDWINVGASTMKANKELPATFSNYGKQTVDLFAPGYRIYTAKPDNKYGTNDGTSFASPMVAGVAALIKSVYPSLTAAQLKEIILKSAVKYPNLKVYLPSENESKKPKKVAFKNLSATGGVLNVYDALKLAETYVPKSDKN